MKHFDIKRGEWPSTAHAPAQRITENVAAQSVALLGSDMPGLRPRFVVNEGAQVTQGQTIFTDRRCSEIVFVAPISGTVKQLAYGPRKTLSACIIDADDTAPPMPDAALPDSDSPAAIRDTLLARGMWPAIRTRPFGRMPAPDDVPDAIFINARATSPQSPDPAAVLADQSQAFRRGASLLKRLTPGEVFVCQAPGDALGPSEAGIIHASFGGSVAAGLSGTHVDRLYPVGPGRHVWTIGYQDVAAIGQLFLTGRYLASRVVSIAGPGATRPRLVQTSLGARLSDLCGDEVARMLSGDTYSGAEAMFLGRFHDQVTLLPEGTQHRPSWMARFFQAQGALIPTRALERALALDILPVPLLRALSVGDSEAAERLGCLALIEEDVAALSRHCTSGADYGVLLRDVLNDLMADAA